MGHMKYHKKRRAAHMRWLKKCMKNKKCRAKFMAAHKKRVAAWRKKHERRKKYHKKKMMHERRMKHHKRGRGGKRVFTVGSKRGKRNSKSGCFKSTKIAPGCKCPAYVHKRNWANRGVHRNAQDIFKTKQMGTTLTVKRVDKAGRDCHGWGMNL